MGLLKLEGFEGYGPDGTHDDDATLIRRLSMRWGNVYGYSGTPASSPGISSNHPRGSGLNWEVVSYNGHAWFTETAVMSDVIFGFAWRPNLRPYNDLFHFRWGSSRIFSLNNTYDGYLTVTDYNSAEAGRSVRPLIKNRRWHYFEVKVFFHPTAGTAVVHHNGVEVINISNKDFGNNYAMDNLKLQYSLNSQHGEQSFDDMYLIDPNTSGVSDFLGPVVIRSLKPTVDTATNDFTPSTGTDHFAVVDNDRADETDYLESSTINDDELFEFANIPSEIVTLKGMSFETAFAVSGSQPKKAVSLCKSGATAVQEVDSLVTIANNWEQFDSILEDDPDTGVPWTISGLNAAQFGVRHKA